MPTLSGIPCASYGLFWVIILKGLSSQDGVRHLAAPLYLVNKSAYQILRNRAFAESQHLIAELFAHVGVILAYCVRAPPAGASYMLVLLLSEPESCTRSQLCGERPISDDALVRVICHMHRVAAARDPHWLAHWSRHAPSDIIRSHVAVWRLLMRVLAAYYLKPGHGGRRPGRAAIYGMPIWPDWRKCGIPAELSELPLVVPYQTWDSE